jgi:hypothetical protein
MPMAEAVADMEQRIQLYTEAYTTVGDDEGAYIKLVDLGNKVITNQVHGRLTNVLVPFLSALHVR